MEAQDITLILASIGGLICSVIYAMKHIKKSECCGSKCIQDTGENDTEINSTIV
jgi:hypothetical protein